MRTVLAAVLLTSCIPAEESPAPAQVAPAVAPEVVPPGTAEHMRTHYRDALEIKEAVIAGDLPGVREPARRLREVPGPSPASWRPYIDKEAELATRTLSARNLATAAKMAGGLANSCGACHEALGGGPRFDPPAAAPVPIAHQAREHMLRHQWAADRMWDALVSRNDDIWASGADLLADAPLQRDDLTADVELPEELLLLGDRVHGIGAQARTTTAWPARAELYGEFIATCAACHLGGC